MRYIISVTTDMNSEPIRFADITSFNLCGNDLILDFEGGQTFINRNRIVYFNVWECKG